MNVGFVVSILIAIFVLVCLSACFSCSDIVYATVNQLRLKKDAQKGSKSAALALNFAKNYNSTITTVLFSNNLVNIAASSLATVLAINIASTNNVKEGIISTIFSISLLLIILIFGEILPKVIGRTHSYVLSKAFAYPIYSLKIIFFPFVWITSTIGKAVAYLFVGKAKDEASLSDEELEEMVETIEEEGVIDEDQSELLKSAIDFKDTRAYEIMTPRVDMFAIDVDDDIKTWMKNDSIFKHSRIPVYKGNIDNIIGILPTKPLLKEILSEQPISIKALIIPVKFVPHTMGISEILKQMKESKNHIVIVKDEFGGTDGLLTMEDILEELVGDMFDEMDKIHENIYKVSRYEYIVDGAMNIEDFFEFFNSPKADGDFTSVGGFVINELGRFAKKGDKINYEDLRIEVKEVAQFTVEKILVHIIHRRNN